MFDPLLSKTPTSAQPYPESFWASTINSFPTTTTLTDSVNADVVIIGAGYAGMSTALHLARQSDLSVVLLEANGIAWGASGRNAGFVLPLSGRLGYKALVDRFGMDTTLRLHNEFLSGVSLVESLIGESGHNVDRQPNGYLKIAHRKKYYAQLVEQADYMQRYFGYDVEPLTTDELKNHYVDHKEAFGALRYQQGYGINPMKLALAYHSLLPAEQCQLFTQSPVLSWKQKHGYHLLQTPQGQVKAKKVVCCSNGYTTQSFHPAIDKRLLPVQTSVLVTSPLTDDQIASSGFKTNQVMMDTRELKYYYRKLPDNRILFGGRGAISGKASGNPIYHDRLLTALKRSFPTLHAIKADYKWSGWISVSLDSIPHIHEYNDSVFYAAGYCGAGVSFSTLAGKRLAEKVLGLTAEHTIPTLQTPLPVFPFSPFRRVGQRLFYEYGRIKDRYL